MAGRLDRDSNLLLIYTPDPAIQRWVEEEIADPRITFYVVRKVADLVWALSQDVPPRPQILVADFDALSPAELLELHAVRERWYGSIIALGTVAPELEDSLKIDFVIAPPFGSEVLRAKIGEVGLDRLTKKMPKLRR